MEKQESKIIKELQKQNENLEKENIELKKQYAKATAMVEIEKLRREAAELDVVTNKMSSDISDAVALTAFGIILGTAFYMWHRH